MTHLMRNVDANRGGQLVPRKPGGVAELLVQGRWCLYKYITDGDPRPFERLDHINPVCR
jgi:hypothetical protein